MRINHSNTIRKLLTIVLTFQLISPTFINAHPIAPNPNYLRTSSYFTNKNTKKSLAVRTLKPLQQNSNLQLFGPNNDTNPVVNETNQIQLTAMDNGSPVTGVTFESGSPDIASIDEKGMVSGKVQGYATVTAHRGSDSVSIFVTVAKVNGNKGKQVTGDTKVDSSGAIYISDPTNHIIFKQESSSADAETFAGQTGSRGKSDGDALKSLFAGPTAVAVDNRAQGGIYVADTLNHSIRKVDFNNAVTTVLGTGSPGVNTQNTTSFSQATFRSPQGIAVNSAGNIFIADTENHAIYLVDFTKQEVRLLAGEPGVSGKVDAIGRSARLFRPTAISVQSGSSSFFGSATSEVLMVADTGNNRIRSISMDGTVTTLGKINTTSAQLDSLSTSISPLAESDEFVFNAPRSVSVDELGNVFVVDNSGAKVITQTAQQTRVMSSLGQPNVSFSQAMSVVVRGTQAFVLDNKASSDAEALKVVTVGQPAIDSLSQDMDKIDGGSEIVVKGKNFGPESIVVLGDSLVRDAIVESATSIRLIVPAQNAPGKRTLSIQTRGGVTQQEFSIFSPPFKILNDGEITTIAGGIPFLGDGGQALRANLKFCRSIATDGEGNIYIVDTAHNRIRKIDKGGTITSVAGTGASGSSPDGGPAIATPLDLVPAGSITVDETGNLLISETTNHRVRRVDGQTGIISTIAGNGQLGFSGDNALATNAMLQFPGHAVADSSGNIFITDSGNNRIRKIDTKTGVITTVIGNGQAGFSGDNGPALQSSLNIPSKIVFDPMGNLLIADTANHRIRLFDVKTGIIKTIAGNGRAGFSGDGGSPTEASLNSPKAITIAPGGGIFIADTGNRRIRRFDIKEARITTIAGTGMPGSLGEGELAIRANIGIPEDVDLDGANNLLIADSENSLIRSVARNNIIRTIAGNGRQNFGGDGNISPLASIDLLFDGGIVTDRASNIFFIDQSNQRIRRIDSKTGIINTVAGNGQKGFSGDGGSALQASLLNPRGIALDLTGNLLIADTGNNRVRRIDQAGSIRTIAGNGQPGFSGDNGVATNASLTPTTVGVTLTGDIVIASADRVRRIDSRTSIITTLAGNGQKGFSGDGGLATNASFNNISSVAIDKLGNLIISDQANNRVRRVDMRTRIITTIAGNGMRGFMSDGIPATMTSLAGPMGVTVDIDNNIIFADSFNHRIRRINVRTGMIQTLVGTKRGFDGDGEPGLSARLNKPTGVAVNLEGDLAISDTDNNSIRLVKRFDRLNIAPDFSINVTPEIQSVVAGNSASFTIAVDALNNFTGSSDLTAMVSPLNRGVNTSFSPSAISPGRSSTMTVAISPDVQATSLSIRITGGAGPLRRSRNVSLSVTRANNNPTTADFSLSLSPNSQMVKAGSTTSFTVGVTTRGTLSQGVNLSASIDQANSNIQTSFSPSSLTATGGNVTLTVTTSNNSPATTFNIAITATSGSITRNQTAILSITAPPPAPSPAISNAIFTKPTLTITGTAFGSSGAVINVNQQNISSFLTRQSETQIVLTGTKKKLGIKKGVNQVTVTVNGVVSNSFTFNF